MGPETNRGSFLDRVAGKPGSLGGEEVIWASGDGTRSQGLTLQGTSAHSSFHWVLWIPLFTSGFELMNLECTTSPYSPAFDSSCLAWMSRAGRTALPHWLFGFVNFIEV